MLRGLIKHSKIARFDGLRDSRPLMDHLALWSAADALAARIARTASAPLSLLLRLSLRRIVRVPAAVAEHARTTDVEQTVQRTCLSAEHVENLWMISHLARQIFGTKNTHKFVDLSKNPQISHIMLEDVKKRVAHKRDAYSKAIKARHGEAKVPKEISDEEWDSDEE